MTTKTNSILEEGTNLGIVLDDAQHACPETISRLYTIHHRHVLRVCRRYFRRQEDAEDAAAEVFLKLHGTLKQKDDLHLFQPWVSQVAIRHCIDKLRKIRQENASCIAGIEEIQLPDHFVQSPLAQVCGEKNSARSIPSCVACHGIIGPHLYCATTKK